MRRKIRRLATWIIAGLTFLFVMAVVGVGLYTQTEHFRVLLQDQETGWNLAHLLKPSDQPQEPQTLAIFLDRLKIEGGRIEARPAGSEEVHLTALALDGNLALLPSGTQAEVATLNFSLARAGAP